MYLRHLPQMGLAIKSRSKWTTATRPCMRATDIAKRRMSCMTLWAEWSLETEWRTSLAHPKAESFPSPSKWASFLAAPMPIAFMLPRSFLLMRRWNNVKLEATIGVLGLVYDKDKAIAVRFSDLACHPSMLGDAYRGQIP